MVYTVRFHYVPFPTKTNSKFCDAFILFVSLSVARLSIGYHITIKSGNKSRHKTMVIVLLFIKVIDRVGQLSGKQIF